MKKENKELFEKSKRGALQLLFSRFGIILVLLLIQVLLLFGLLNYVATNYIHLYYTVNLVFTLTGYTLLFNSSSDNSVKMTWMVVFTVLPVVGILLYLYTQLEFGHRYERRRLIDIIRNSHHLIQSQPKVKKELEANKDLKGIVSFLNQTNTYPAYRNSDVTYFPSGEEKFAALLEELKQAKSFIFMEYFIVGKGEMWSAILEVLIQKAQEGVEVRFMYDGFCEFSLLPRSYSKELEKMGIKCRVFSPIQPFVSTVYNFRDHRKICVIDGQVAFTGGVNLADEYINKVERFGHWKDTAVRVKGEAVESFTLMFLQIWANNSDTSDFGQWLNVPKEKILKDDEAKGWVVPYADSPLDAERVGEMIYFDLLNKAQDSVQIMSPYLILDGEMETALTFAAKRGVKVDLILPHVPDKKYAFALAKSHYKTLIEAGVNIYEYTPGFVHAKVFLVDQYKATVGTVNLDYRSFYHHFECGVYLEDVPSIEEISEDFKKTLSLSQKVTLEDVQKEKALTKITGWVLKIFAPLM